MASCQHELPALIQDISKMKVDQLKSALRNIAASSMGRQYSLKQSGLKNELFQRLRGVILEIIDKRNPYDVSELKRCIAAALQGSHPTAAQVHAAALQASNAANMAAYGYPVGGPAQYGHHPPNARAAPPPTAPKTTGDIAREAQRARADYYAGHGGNSYGSGSGAAAGGSAYRPNNAAPFPSGSGAAAMTSEAIPMRFVTSPFFRVEKALSGITTCLRTYPGEHRKSAHCNFALTEAQRALLLAAKASPSNPQYQVQLFSTSESQFNTSRPTASQQPAYMEFPEVCDIKLNSYAVPSSTKGVKNRLGSAPPVDLGKAVALNGQNALSLVAGGINRVEVLYMKTDKKYLIIVYLVEITSVKTAAANMKKAKYRSKEQTISDIVKMNSDPDVLATAYGLSLSDPLTLSRIRTPVRSIACSHIACFDAEVFLKMNEQTPTWNCPICSKVLLVEDITVDGYFDYILQNCPTSMTSVTIEPDGTWRSSDNKYGTAVGVGTAAASANENGNGGGSGAAANSNGKGKGRADLTIDSDDDGKGRVFSVGSSATPPGRNGNGNGKAKTTFIDLTLSSDDEDDYGGEDDDQPAYVPASIVDPVQDALDKAVEAEVEAAKRAAAGAASGHRRMMEAAAISRMQRQYEAEEEEGEESEDGHCDYRRREKRWRGGGYLRRSDDDDEAEYAETTPY